MSRKPVETLIEIPKVIQVTRSDPLNLTVSRWVTGRKNKHKQPVPDGWVKYGYYNTRNLRYPLLEFVSDELLRGDIVAALKEIDAKLDTISKQLTEVIDNV